MTKSHSSSLESTPPVRFKIESLSNPIRPEWFQGVHEARLAQAVSVTQFGVNRVTLDPGSYSALRHWHEGEDEFIFVLEGQLTLIDENGMHDLEVGSFVGFHAGDDNAHHLANMSEQSATYLAVGTHLDGKDIIHYPDDDLGPVRR